MNQAEYVNEARALRDRHVPRLGARILLPGGGKRYLRQLADALNALLGDLKRLNPPASDASDLEIHFIAPMTELATYLQCQADSAPKSLTFRRAMAILRQGPEPSAEYHSLTRPRAAGQGPGASDGATRERRVPANTDLTNSNR